MAITTKHHDNTKADIIEFTGRVLRIRTFIASRNHSDTLDYTDMRSTEVTEALVYVGRLVPSWIYSPVSELNPLREASVHELFRWVDCTNLFAWRNGSYKIAEQDCDLEDQDELADYVAWCAFEDEQAKLAAERLAVNEKARREAAELAEKNRVVKGKKMRVCKGRKVPVGLVGVVSYISGSGSVLLKDEANWQDRNAPGTWVSASNLASV